MFNKKGQAALEFLTTYGWAFLVILVMIGALAYFGVLNPERFVPERCKLSGELECNTFALINNGTNVSFGMSLKNNLQDQITITNLTLVDPTDGDRYDLTMSPHNVSGGDIDEISPEGFRGSTLLPVSQGEKVRYNVEVTWFKVDFGSDFKRTSTGDIVATVS